MLFANRMPAWIPVSPYERQGFTSIQASSFPILITKSFLSNLDYSRVEVAVDARHWVRSCGPSPRVPCNKADAVRSTRLKGKKMVIKIKNKNTKIVEIIIFEKILHITEENLIIKTSPFFYEYSG